MKIEIGRSVYEDYKDLIHKTENGIECCGKHIKLTSHWDGSKTYGSTYVCECGNVISVTTQRDEDDPMCWDEGEEEQW